MRSDNINNANESGMVPASMASLTVRIVLYNNGADSKTDIRLSVSDAAGVFKRILLAGKLDQGQTIDVDLVPLNMKVAQAAVMYRGKDGIGRYLYSDPADSGRYFATLNCGWISLPLDPTIEESYLIGQ